MTPKSAKRVKASGDKKESFSSPQAHLTSSNDLGMASPNLVVADGNHSESRKKRKKQHARVDTPSAISQTVARGVSEWNDKPDSVPDDTTTNDRPCTRIEGESQGPEDQVLPLNAPSVITNLELVRVLQDSKISRSRKIEEAYKFIKNLENILQSRDDNERTDFKIQDRVLMAMPQFVSFLSEWVQSAVLWSSKPQQLTKINDSLQREEGQKVIPSHLDARYWAILRWCLSSGHLHKFASVSSSLMRPLNLYINALIEPGNSSECELDLPNKFGLSTSLTEDSFRSVEVLLLANERSFRPDLDHWVSLASTALSKLVTLNRLASDLDGNMTSLVRRLILCILVGFSRFVAIHPNRRKIFTSLTENLLEFLLEARATLTNQISQVSLGESSSSLQRLLQTLEDILEKGLFHAAHVGSFQDVCTVLAGKVDVNIEPGTTEKKRKRNSNRDLNGNVDEGNKDMHLSYHRLLFQKLDNFRRRGIEAALVELGWIFKTYSKSFKSHQVSEEIDVFGFQSKGKKPESLDLAANDDENNNGKREGGGKPVHDAQLGDKKDRNSEALFNVFAEFIGPLTTDLKSFDFSHASNDVNASFQHVFSAKVLLGAVAGLLKAAKTENTYVPTEDSNTQAHFSFLDGCFNTVVGVGKSLPSLFASVVAKAHKGGKIAQVRSSSNNMDQHQLEILFADILREMIIAINYLIELDYRVVENSLGDVWIILLAGVALQQTSRRDDLSFKEASTSIRQEAIEVACHVINIFSDLRQVDQALFSFCVTIRRFMSQGSAVSHLGQQSTPSSIKTETVAEEVSLLTFLNLEAAELLACAKPLLLAISSAMQALPEGQVAEFLRLLTVDALESIPLVNFSENLEQKFRAGDGESGKKRITVGLKALVELYCCMLDNVNIVGTNSIHAGKAIREFLMQIVTPKLVHLIDFFTLSNNSEDDTTIVLQTKEKMDAIGDSPRKRDSAAPGKTFQDDSLLNTWSLVFLLRLYITTQSLHRECISLMPPKAAKKARDALDGPAIDNLKGDITDILLRFGAASFLSGVGKGAVRVSHFFAGIEGKQDSEELVNCPSLSYLLECIALQSLAQLSRHIEAVSFLITRFKVANVVSNGSIKTKDPGSQSIGVENGDLSAAKAQLSVQKKLQKLLKDLKKESQKLAKFLLREVGWQEDNRDAKLTSEILNCVSHGDGNTFPSERVSKVGLLADQQSPKQNWDSVESTLTVDTLPIQRWNLVCKSFDIWAKFAAEEELRKFVVFLFSSSLVVLSTTTASEEQKKMPKTKNQEHYWKQITDDLLCNALFYEEESFRRVLPSTFVEELKKSSLSAFGTWPFESHALNSFLAAEVLSHIGQQWSDFTIEIEAVIEARGQEQAPSSVSKMKRRETYGFSNQASEKRDDQLQDTTPVKGDQLTSTSSASKRQRPDSVNGKAPSKQSKKRWSDSHLNALDHCVRLVRHLSALPSGYIESNECTTCAYTLLCFERLLTSSLLELRAAALGSSRASATVPTVFKLLQALSACRSALLALTSSDTFNVSNSMLMAFLSRNFSSSRWLPLSIQVATISLVDSLECSNLPAQERSHMVSLGKSLLYEVLKSTATIVTVLTKETLSIEERKGSIQDDGPTTITTKVVGANAECSPPTMDSKAGRPSLIELIDYQVERIDQLITNSFDAEVDFAQHEETGCHHTSGMKAYFEGLTLSSSLSSYFWSLRKFSEKLTKDQNRPLGLPIPSLCHAQKVGLVLTGTLLRALVPAGSHAVLLLGEHEVDRTYDSEEKKFNITIVSQSHQEDNELATIGDEDEVEEDDEGADLPIVFSAAEGSGDEEDEQKDIEEQDLDGQNDYSLHLETYGGIREGEFGKHGSETETTVLVYTSKSNLQRSLLENLLRSSCSNKCEIIGELYLATAGILKLESIHLSDSKLSLVSASSPDKGSQFQEGLPSAVNLLMGAGYWLLMKAAEDSQPGHWSHLGWLIGVVKYLDAAYCLTPYIKPPLPSLAFSKLFNMHIHLLGSLTPSEEQFHSLKLPLPLDVEDQQVVSNDQVTEGDGSHNKDAKASSPHYLRTAVRESLGSLLRTASRYHSVLALQSIMRALVGVSDSNHSSGLEIGRFEDGKVGRRVAAGVECLSIALETVSGGALFFSQQGNWLIVETVGCMLKCPMLLCNQWVDYVLRVCAGIKRLRLLANHFHEFFGAIFNIMEYLQGPSLFLESGPPLSQGDSIEAEIRSTSAGSKVHSGPVILQALQILITTASRDAIFPMKACHVALALHCPARLFWPVYRSGLSKQEFILKHHSAAERTWPGKLKNVHGTGVVRIGTELAVKLYVSCCRLLCSILRHHRRESGHCIALLGDSARVLLHCLEAPNWLSSHEDGTKQWSIKMSAYCASWLRRIYEEIGEHKETLGKYCSHVLSDYLSVISGHGPHAAGLIREVEAALQPGAYVLVDACSANDLQQLHASLGEGPRRNALLNLRRQYQQRFQYKGKV